MKKTFQLFRYEHEDWALIHEESPKNNPLISQHSVINLFNHTATFRTESDLPLTFQYLENLDVITDEVCLFFHPASIAVFLIFLAYSVALENRNYVKF